MLFNVFQKTIVDEFGNTLPSAAIDVYVAGTLTRATLYSDLEGATPITNPFNADGNGFAQFYTESGSYDISANLGGSSATWSDVELGRNLNTGFKNYIVNGKPLIWQRGNSFTIAINGEATADTWFASASGMLVDRVIKPNGSYSLRSRRGAATASFQRSITRIELPKDRAGTTMTLSGIVEFNITSNEAYATLGWVDGTSHTIQWSNVGVDRTLLNVEQYFTYSFTVPDDATDYSYFKIFFLGNAVGTTEYDFEVSELQLEKGSISTSFENLPTSIYQLLCERYYKVIDQMYLKAAAVPPYSTGYRIPIAKMRAIPSSATFTTSLGTSLGLIVSADSVQLDGIGDVQGRIRANNIKLDANFY